MTAESIEIVSLGHIVREHIFFPGRSSEEVLGSPVAYSSVAIARQGVGVGIVTKVGLDMPDHLLQPFRDAGVDLRGLRVDDSQQTTTTHLRYDEAGNKTIDYLAKAEPLTLADVPSQYRGARLLNICTMDHDVPIAEIEALAKLGIPMAVDLGGYGGAHAAPQSCRVGLPLDFNTLIRHFHIVKASDEDCRRLTGDELVSDETLGHRILEMGARIFIATRGARGALILLPGERHEIAALPGDVVDVTGGGDTFLAGFLVAYLKTGDPVYSGHWATATARCVIERTGGVRAERMPSFDEVARRMNAACIGSGRIG